jgi:hypothetical protein
VVVSKFDDLSTDQQIAALRQLALGGFAAAIGALTILISRGLMSPDEFSRVIRPVVNEVEKVGQTNDEAIDKIIDGLGRLKALATETWKGE